MLLRTVAILRLYDPKRSQALALQCWSAGMDLVEVRRLGSAAVKIFPASTCGPGHIKSLRGPFPNIALVPSGGVTLSTAAAFLDAGAVAVFAGSDLVSPAMVENEAYDEVLTRAAGYVAAVSS
jgi:2-dehydro-3-deoxyphosphogluconate aldolase/(4S)-4-hydroxy-2-oxoglutarate aldolase